MTAFWLAACQEPAAAAPAIDAPSLTLVREDPSDAPIAGIEDALLARFEEGDARFELPFRDSQGLGPLYVHRSCASCHEDDGRGPGAVRRVAFLGDRAARAARLPHGDVVRPRLAAGAAHALLAPEGDDVREELRLGPPIFARGYLEAVPDETIRGYARAQSERDDGIHGRAHEVPRASAVPLRDETPRLGRFGLKARIASLEEFVADALVSDMGLTSPLRPEEPSNPDGLTDDLRPGVDVERDVVDLITDYVRLLALPRRDADVEDASALFEAARCGVCHVPRVRTRRDHPVDALRGVEVSLYTDLLLHDMGEGLADGIPEHDATGSEWRTAPLIGLRFSQRFLHDGSARTVAEAIAAHASEGSEANDSVRRFDALAPRDRARLVAWVEAL